MTEANVGSFAVDYERAYRWNQSISQHGDLVDLDIELREEPSVTRTDGGYAVRFGMAQKLKFRPEATGTVTPPDVGYGLLEYDVGYFITDRLVKRSQGPGATPTTPSRGGSVLECNPSP